MKRGQYPRSQVGGQDGELVRQCVAILSLVLILAPIARAQPNAIAPPPAGQVESGITNLFQGDCNQNGIQDSIEIQANPALDCNGNGILDVCELAVDDPAPGGPFFCTANCLADCDHNGKPDICDLNSRFTSSNIATNGNVTSNPAYPYSMENYDTVHDLGDLRDFAAANGIVPPINEGEDRSEYDWRVATTIMSWVANHLNYNGLDSDPSLAPRAIQILDGAIHRKSLILGGAFTHVDGPTPVDDPTPATGTAELAGRFWSPMELGPDGVVNAICEFNGELIVAGHFTKQYPDRVIAIHNIARWDGNTWHPLGSDTVNGVNGTVNALVVQNGTLYAGGGFTLANWDGGSPGAGDAASHIASWDGASWSSLGAGVDGNVNALTTFDGKLIAGLQSSASGQSRLLTWDGMNFFALGGGSGPDQRVDSFGTFNGKLIVGGGFSNISGTTASKVASWDGTKFAGLNSGIAAGSLTTVKAICVFQNKLVIGGRFTSVAGLPNTKYIAQWDGASWSALGPGIVTNLNWVSALLVHDGKLVAATQAVNSGGDAGNFAEQWDGAAWSAVGNGTGINGPVNALCEYNYHWACATVAKTVLGLCVAHGIPARIVSGTSPMGDLDTELEVYDPRNSKWVLFLAPYNNWVEDADGIPQSLAQLKAHNDAGNIAITESNGVFSFAAANNSGLIPMPATTCQAPLPPRLSTPWWCGLPDGSGTLKLLYHNTTDYINKFNNETPLEEGINNYDDGMGSPFVGQDDPNLSYPLNQMEATSTTLVNGATVIFFINNLNDTTHGFDLDHFEGSDDGGQTWWPFTLIGGGAYRWRPTSLETLLACGVSTSGARSPTVTITSTPDCNHNGVPDTCDITSGVSSDCNGNYLPDDCEIAFDPSLDCNHNGIPDTCEIATGAILDCNGNNIPDACEGPLCLGILAGDVNCSGTVGLDDISGFVAQLLDGKYACQADMNHDGSVDGRDLGFFIRAVVP